MKVSILQMNVRFGEPDANIDRMECMLAEQMDRETPDAFVLPELWSTGFYPKPLESYADRAGERTCELLSRLARKYHVNLVGGSVITSAKGRFHNQCFIFDREGKQIASYCKAHLFSPAKEEKAFAAGDSLCVFSLDGIRCGMAICYDIRFPEFIRRLALQDISVLFVSAAWPVQRTVHWQTLLRARAIENQMFVAAANAAGRQPTMQCAGHSMLIDPWGEVLAEAGDEEICLPAELDLSILQGIRSKINVFADRRPELYCEILAGTSP